MSQRSEPHGWEFWWWIAIFNSVGFAFLYARIGRIADALEVLAGLK